MPRETSNSILWVYYKEEKVDDNFIDEAEKEQNGLKCASFTTGPYVISVCVAETYILLDNCCQDFFILECPVSYHGVKGRKTSLAIKTPIEEATNDAVAWQ